MFSRIVVAGLIAGLGTSVGAAAPALMPMLPAFMGVNDAFTYQGQLKQSGEAFNGTVDATFRLYGSLNGNDQIGAGQSIVDLFVADGLIISSGWCRCLGFPHPALFGR